MSKVLLQTHIPLCPCTRSRTTRMARGNIFAIHSRRRRYTQHSPASLRISTRIARDQLPEVHHSPLTSLLAKRPSDPRHGSVSHLVPKSFSSRIHLMVPNSSTRSVDCEGFFPPDPWG